MGALCVIQRVREDERERGRDRNMADRDREEFREVKGKKGG